MRHTLITTLAATFLAGGLAACGETDPQARALGADAVRADGSSTVYPLTREAARRFMRARNEAQVDVAFSGTTAGFRKFCAGEIDIADASRPMNAGETALCARNGVAYRTLPIALDSIAIVVNPKNTWTNDLSVEELRTLWSPESEGKPLTWKSLRPDWPEQPIVLFGRGEDSGTYDVFTTEVVGATRSSRKDYTASEDEELLAQGIAREPNALGFFGIGGYHRHWDELKLVAVDGGEGPVFPTLDTVKQGKYRPLTRPLFLYVNEASLQAKPVLKPFLEAYLDGIESWIHFTGYMPLSAEDYRKARERLGGQP